tara:strand:+ start:267 stop:674 length:408 start_codon:yes stop_codon:yes gene_type:complete
LAIDLGRAASSKFTISNSGIHFYKIELAEGTTYTVDILDTLKRSTVVLTDNETEALTLNIDSGDNLVSSIVWTAPRSDTYFIIVNGGLNDSYIFTVNDEASARSPVPGQTTTPGISPTTPPSAGALTFASMSAGS